MTPDLLAGLLGVVLSLAAAYIPGFATWYGGFTGPTKGLVMAGMLLLVAAAAMVVACAGYADAVGLPLTCDEPGLVALIRAFLAALVANQAAYQALVRPRQAAR